MNITLDFDYSAEQDLIALLSRMNAGTEVCIEELVERSPKYEAWITEAFSFELEVIASLNNLKVKEHSYFDFLFNFFDQNMEFSIASLLSYETKDLPQTLEPLLNVEIRDIPELKRAIIQSLFSESTKYRLLLLIDEKSLVQEYYDDFMGKMTPVLEKMENQLPLIKDQFIQECESSDFIDVLKTSKIPLDNINELRITPSIVGGQVATIWYDEKDRDVLRLKLGILVYRMIGIRNLSSRSEINFLRSVKILSDQTKIDILKFCASQERYGTEIAQQLGISGATVSHHMSALSSNNYVSLRIDKNRVYYRSDIEAILKDLELGKEVFSN